MLSVHFLMSEADGERLRLLQRELRLLRQTVRVHGLLRG